MEIIKNPNPAQWDQILKRPTQSLEALNNTVDEVFAQVRENGDEALKSYTKAFDGVNVADLAVSEEEFKAAEDNLSAALKKAILQAKSNIEKFHTAQQTPKISVETQP